MADVVDHATPAKRKSTEGCDNGEQNCKSHCGGIDRGTQPIDLHLFGSNREEWAGKSVISTNQFPSKATEVLFKLADEMKELYKTKGGDGRLEGKLMATLFYENSTRTVCSFQVAMMRLGGKCIHVNDSSSSVNKGEGLSDTMATLLLYCDVLALRHPEIGSVGLAAKGRKKPILNAGDGAGEHPTQALTDFYTIHKQFGSLDGKQVAFVGDVKYSRPIHSLARLLVQAGCKIHYVSQPGLSLPNDLMKELEERGGKGKQFEHIVTTGSIPEDVIASIDILYVVRNQLERFSKDDLTEDVDIVKVPICITPAVLSRAKSNMIVLHPFPRTAEISVDCDNDPRTKYFEEIENGMFIRMALLALLLGKA